MEQLVATVEDKKCGQEVAKNSERVSETKSQRLFPKTHVGYWKTRLEHRTYSYRGKNVEIGEWSVRIKFRGVRRSFELETASKADAATKARDIYLSLVAKGWDATVAAFCKAKSPLIPNAPSSETAATVGVFLKEVERVSNLKPKTFRRYAQYFRMLTAQIRGFSHDRSKYSYQRGKNSAWLEKIDSTRLQIITPAAAADWKMAYLKRAGTDPRRRLEVNRSFNAALRHCKSLFSANIINQPNFSVLIPKFKVKDGQKGEREIYWFESLKFEKSGSMKFYAPPGVTYSSLLMAARSELRSVRPESYKLLLLCLCAGLRRAEADTLLCNQLQPTDNSIRVESTAYRQPKHDSCGIVYVDPALMQELLHLTDRTDEFVVRSPVEWKSAKYNFYRCEPHWKILIEWLAGKGIVARKKVHELRKLFGDAIVKQNGIFAGSAQLRHTTIQMTASYYTDPRQRAVLPVGSLFSNCEAKVTIEN
jgi:integrase